MSRTSYLSRLFDQLFGDEDDAEEDHMILEQGYFESILAKERDEAKNGDFGFSVITMPMPSTSESNPDVKATALFLLENLRLIDELGWMPNSRMGVFLVDTTKNAAERFMARLCNDFQCPMPVKNVEILSYPEDEHKLFDDTIIRRRTERLPLGLDAKVLGIENGAELKTKDVSSRGAYLLTDQPLGADSEIEIEISLPFSEVNHIEGENVVLRAKGRVIRSDENGTAVEFTHECDFMNVE